MYIINQKPKYYIWNFRKKENYKTFNNKTEFLAFIAKQFREDSVVAIDKAGIDISFKKKITNTILRKCICSKDDVKTVCKYTTYQLFDEYDRILSPTDVWEEAIKIWEKYYQDPSLNMAREQKAWRERKNQQMRRSFSFRNSPVPHTGKHRFHWRIGFRSPKTTALKKYCCAPEQKMYNRRSWKQLPSVYDDIFRCEEKNWKSQSKRRHQWKPKPLT